MLTLPKKNTRGFTVRFYLLLLATLFLTLSACISAEESAQLSQNNLVAQASLLLEEDESPPVNLQIGTNAWFQSNTKLLSSFELEIEEGTAEDQFPIYWIRPKRNTFRSPPRYHFLFFYTKSSIFFDKSVTDILATFFEKDIPVDAFAVLSENPQSIQEALNRLNRPNIDLIFTMGSDATAFVHETYQQGDIPVVTVLSKDPVLLGQMPDYEQGSGNHITYTSVGVPIDVQMSYFKQLIPDLKHIAVLYGKQNSSAVETQVEPLRKYAQKENINIIDVAVEDRTQVVEELDLLMPEAIRQMSQSDPEMKHSIFLITGSSSVSNALDLVDELAQKIPVVTLLPNLVQESKISPVFGIGVNFDSNSKLAAKYAFDILEGQMLPSDLPVGVIAPPDLAINFAEARKIGLKIPFRFFESASTIYGPDRRALRLQGKIVE